MGVHNRDYLAGNGLQLRTKLVALSTLWASVLLSVVLVVLISLVDGAILLIAAAVTVYILRLPTCAPGDACR